MVPPVKRLPRSTPAGSSAASETPPARTLGAFEIKEGPIHGLGLWKHITAGFAAIMGSFVAFFNVSSKETIHSGALVSRTRTHITGTLAKLAHALFMAVMLHYVWLTLGSFLYNRVDSTNIGGQPETFGGITNTEDGLALAAVPAEEKWNRGSNNLISVMVDSGASVYYFKDALIPGLRYRLDNYQELAIWRWITTAGGHQLEGSSQGMLCDHTIDAQGVQRLIQISMLIVPGFGRNLFSVKQASRNRIVSIFDKHNPRLEANNFTLPLQDLEIDLHLFSLDLVSGRNAPELAMQAAATATLWQRRMGHLSRRSPDLLKKANNNGVSASMEPCQTATVAPWGKAVNGPTPRQPTNTSSALSS